MAKIGKEVRRRPLSTPLYRRQKEQLKSVCDFWKKGGFGALFQS